MATACPSDDALLLYLGGRSPESEQIRAHVVACDACRDVVAAEARTEPLFDGKYEIERELGSGGMGRVVLARHVKLGKTVAIKLLRADLARDRHVVERLTREARAAATLKSPHVVQVYDIDMVDGEPYIVMEHLVGTDLGTKIAREGPLPISDALRFVRHACHALAEAHAAGIVHRDVKPANLFLTDQDIVKVLDFGIAKALPASVITSDDATALTMRGDILGSPRFMSPEQFGGEIDHRSDIWSLGVTLYVLLSGEPPFSGNDLAELRANILRGAVVPLSSRRPEIPRRIIDAVSRCLAVDRADRWNDVEAFASALDEPALADGVASRSLPFDIDRYTVLRSIASGGMGTVFLARSRGARGFSRPVALKRLHRHLAASDDTRRQFLDEARIVAQIEHPHVVKVLDVVEAGAEIYLVMEYIHGETLHHLLAASKRVDLRVIAAIFCDVAEALHAAHEARGEDGEALGVVHRDVSPHNVLVAKQGAAYVTDFGVAKVRTQLDETHGHFVGKSGYAAPEQLEGGGVTRAVDIFALGVMLWESLARRRLFSGDTERDPTTAPPSRFGDGVPRALDALVLSMIARAPEERPASALDVAHALRKIVEPARDAEVGAWVVSLARKKLDAIDVALAAPRPPSESDASIPVAPREIAAPARRQAATTSPARLRVVALLAVGLALAAGVVAVTKSRGTPGSGAQPTPVVTLPVPMPMPLPSPAAPPSDSIAAAEPSVAKPARRAAHSPAINASVTAKPTPPPTAAPTAAPASSAPPAQSPDSPFPAIRK